MHGRSRAVTLQPQVVADCRRGDNREAMGLAPFSETEGWHRDKGPEGRCPSAERTTDRYIVGAQGPPLLLSGALPRFSQ